MKTLTLISLLCLSSFICFGQQFVPAIPSTAMSGAKNSYVIKNDGTKIIGKVTSSYLVKNVLKSFTFKTESGEKFKFKAEDVKEVGIKTLKIQTYTQAVTANSITELAGRDFNKVVDQEYFYFEQALLPGKKNKFALMQLLNPGFDHVVKVYKDPNAKETTGLGVGGIKVTGGIDKSYLVCDAGSNRAVYLEKKKYTKESKTVIFTKCPDIFEKYYGGDKFAWRDFAEHVYVYDQLCGDQAK
ncbi:hypothetical protein [Flammeovirga sp. OC4]|uniref:hypothetical protein n=1 Tax=Flammeovirga sp. OC4 TaxID=1382345 RepID=UPI0012DFF02B|nr:hypothetical protein [Flammeovirga sp. OC4]